MGAHSYSLWAHFGNHFWVTLESLWRSRVVPLGAFGVQGSLLERCWLPFWTQSLQRFSLKRASRSHAKTGFFLAFLVFFFLFFLSVFPEALRWRFFLLSAAFRGRFGCHFSIFLWIVRVFLRKGEPSIFDDSTAFWLDFQGLVRPETMINQEKGYTIVGVFLVVEKTAPESVFPYFQLDFDVIFESKSAPKG